MVRLLQKLANNCDIAVLQSQNISAMSLSRRGIYNECFVANFALSLALKDYLKSIDISGGYRYE